MAFLINLRTAGTTVAVDDPINSAIRYTFPADNRRMRKRVKKIGSKEPGTVEWLHRTLRPDDTVLDIGANIGIYSVFAAARTSHGKVYAVEPHAGNFAMLLRSIHSNQLQQRITPLNIALDTAAGWIDFSYNDLKAGSSGSQLATSPAMQAVPAVVTEQKPTQSVDGMIAAGWLKPPDVIKIDVDGNELNILNGMHGLLATTQLRSLQVEADPEQEQAIIDLLAGFDYRLVDKHLSAPGAKHLAKHGPAASYAYNCIFEKRAAGQSYNSD